MQNIGKISDFFKLVSDQTRLKIIVLLSRGELCVCEIEEELDISQPRVSHHLRVLKENNLVNSERDGKWIYYFLAEELFKDFELVTESFLELRKEFAKADYKSKCREEAD